MMSAKLTVITGPMFSGKTGILLWHARRAKIAEIPVQVFVPALDDRHGVGVVRSHDGMDLSEYGMGAWTIAAENVHALASRIRYEQALVLIDEAQFLPQDVVDQVRTILKKPRHVVIGGLSQDYLQRPFGPMPQLLAMADEVRVLTAICADCRSEGASLTRKLGGTSAQIELGSAALYAPLCRACYNRRDAA